MSHVSCIYNTNTYMYSQIVKWLEEVEFSYIQIEIEKTDEKKNKKNKSM